MAHQQFKCNGKSGCGPTCAVEIKVNYFQSGEVEIHYHGGNHGQNFTIKNSKNVEDCWQSVDYFRLDETLY